MTPIPRRTPAAETTLTGVAVRTHGGETAVTLAPGGDGFAFKRLDTGQRLPATLDHMVEVPNCTALGADGQPSVLFVEHVLSALVGLGFTDCEIGVAGPEVPLLDGSARPFVDALNQVGSQPVDGEVEPLVVSEPVWLTGENKVIAALPGDWSLDYTLEHAHPLVGHEHAAVLGLDDYAEAVAPARTFATRREIEALQAQGLIRGGSEDNLVVIHDDRLSSPQRLPAEFATHKALDVIGDLALVGRPVVGRIVAWRTGHADNRALGRKLLGQR